MKNAALVAMEIHVWHFLDSDLACIGPTAIWSHWTSNQRQHLYLREQSLFTGVGLWKSENRSYSNFTSPSVIALHIFAPPPWKLKFCPTPQFACSEILSPLLFHRPPPPINNDRSLRTSLWRGTIDLLVRWSRR